MTEMMTAVMIGVLTAMTLSSFAYILAKIRTLRREEDAIRKGLTALLRDRIIQIYNHHSSRNCIPIYGRENVESLYREYKALGGNGTIDGLVNRLMMLPTENPQNADLESGDVIL